MDSRGSWHRVSRKERCPICGKSDWCRLSDDGAWVLCRRLDLGDGMHRIDKNGEDAWLYRRDRGQDTGHPTPEPAPLRPPKCAPPHLLHQVYHAWLNRTPLERHHRMNLQNRGLSAGEIARREYRSMPRQGRAEIARRLVERFGAQACAQIPGIVRREQDGRSWWSLAGAVGLMIPVRSVDGRIVAVMVRSDDADAQHRYTMMSSRKHGGVAPNVRIHVPLWEGPTPQSIRLTEGALKADIATGRSGIWTLGLPGVSAWRLALPLIKSLQTSTVFLAFDADVARNVHVARALHQTARALTAAGLHVALEQWDEADGKGIDDLLVNGQAPDVLEGRKMRDALEHTLRSAWMVDPMRATQWWRERQQRYERRLRLPPWEVAYGHR
jgi:uncharacterized protein DUF3854